DSVIHRVFSAAQGARRAGDRHPSHQQGRAQAMKNPPPLSPELEALLAPHRAVLPLAPSVEARALARAAAVYVPEPGAGRVLGPLWMFAGAAGGGALASAGGRA